MQKNDPNDAGVCALVRLRCLLMLLWWLGGTAAQAQTSYTWAWAKAIDSGCHVMPWGAVADAAGNTYVTGDFYTTATFGSTTLTAQGGANAFVAKYDAQGNPQWARRIGSATQPPNNCPAAAFITGEGRGICVDSQGAVYVTGSAAANAQVDNVVISFPPSSSQGGTFVAKFSAQGSVLWARGYEPSVGRSIAADTDGSLYVAAFTTVMGNRGPTLYKYDAQGSLLWSRRLRPRQGGIGNEEAQVAVGADHRVYWATDYGVPGSGSVMLDAGAGQNPVQVGNSTGMHYGLLLAQFDAQGTLSWFQTGTGLFSSRGLAVDGRGNAFICGAVSGVAQLQGHSLPARGGQDIYLARFGPTGQLQWVRREGSSSTEYGNDVAVDGAGNCYLTCSFYQGNLSFGSVVVTGQHLYSNLAVVKYDAQGQALWGAAPQGKGAVGYGSLGLDAAGNIYLTAYQEGIAHYGQTTLSHVRHLPEPWASSMGVVARLTPTAAALRIESAASCTFPRQLTAVAASPVTAYRWNTGATTASIAVTQAGIYSVTVTFGSGQIATAWFQVQPADSQLLPAFSLGADTTLCPGQELLLRAPGSVAAVPGVTYRWSDGSTASTLRVRKSGVYTLTVRGGCESQQNQRQVTFRPGPFIPNIITPNGDRRNDAFRVVDPCGLSWTLTIYNRWGRQVFHAAAYRNDWPGEAGSGLYYYHLTEPASASVFKGWVEVVR